MDHVIASVAKQSPECGQGNFSVRGLPRRFAPRNDSLESLFPSRTKGLRNTRGLYLSSEN